jgi:hypothetical protein
MALQSFGAETRVAKIEDDKNLLLGEVIAGSVSSGVEGQTFIM